VCIYKLRAKSDILNVDKGGAGMFQHWIKAGKVIDEKRRAEGYSVVNVEDAYPILKLVTTPITAACHTLMRIFYTLFPKLFAD